VLNLRLQAEEIKLFGDRETAVEVSPGPFRMALIAFHQGETEQGAGLAASVPELPEDGQALVQAAGGAVGATLLAENVAETPQESSRRPKIARLRSRAARASSRRPCSQSSWPRLVRVYASQS